MPTIRHFFEHVKKKNVENSMVYTLSLLMLFWCIFDGIITFVTPLVIVENGFSDTMMGIIIGTSSIAGALFDLFACHVFKSMFFRRVFLIMFGLCIFYPFLLYQAKTFWIFVLAMAVWGVYFDLRNFGNFDLISNHTNSEDHSSSFGVVNVFISLGYMLAPIIAGFVIAEKVGWRPFAISWLFLLVSLFFFLVLILMIKKNKDGIFSRSSKPHKKINFLKELNLWNRIGKLIWPVLIVTFLLNLINAFFLTVGPLLAESFPNVRLFAGFFVAMSSLPALFVGWFVGPITKKYGKKYTAFFSLFIGAILLVFLFWFSAPLLIIGIIFLSSIFTSLALPAINGAYADYISEKSRLENEINGLEDFFTNIGYIIGPMVAGILSDRLGHLATFSVLGVFSAVVAALLLSFSPKKIEIKI